MIAAFSLLVSLLVVLPVLVDRETGGGGTPVSTAALKKPKRKVATLPAPDPKRVLAADGARSKPTAPKTGRKAASVPARELRPHGMYIPVHAKVKFDKHHRIVSPAALAAPPPSHNVPVRIAKVRRSTKKNRHSTASRSGALKASPRESSTLSATGEHTVELASAVTAVTAPSTPTNVSAIPRDGGATISWTAPASNGGADITGYTVTASPGGATATVSGSTTTASIYGLTNGTSYTFTVVATNSSGDSTASSPSAAITPTAAGAPSAVTNLAVTPGNGKATVTWDAPTDDGGADLTKTVLTIYRASDNHYVGYVDVAAPATTATVTNLLDGTAYYLEVYAENRSYYTSDDVQSGDFTPKAGPEPAQPATVSAKPGTGQATVTWTPPADDGGSAVTGYVVTTYDSSDAVVGSPQTAAADATSATVTGLTNGDSYYFGVAATNADGTGPALFTSTVTPASSPGVPTGLTAFPSDKSVLLVWSEPSDTGGSPITSYTVTVNGPDGSSTKKVAGPSALISYLSNGSSYTFTVAAANDAAAGSDSTASKAVTPRDSYTRPVGSLRHKAQPTQSDPNVKYIEARYAPVMSGNGRYVFYFGDLVEEDLDGTYEGDVRNGWYRYDIDTGETIPVWYYSGGEVVVPRTDWAATSYDGSVFSSFAGGELYVWYADSGDITLATPNASGSGTAGWISNPTFSGDGHYLVFSVADNTDMADNSGCSPGESVNDTPWQGDYYRFDTSAKSVQRIPLKFTVEQSGGTLTCAAPAIGSNYDAPGVSFDGTRIAAYVDYCETIDSSNCQQTITSQLIVSDVASGGSATTNRMLQGQGQLTMEAGLPPLLSGDGKTIVTGVSWDSEAGVGEQFVTLNADAPTAAPVVFGDYSTVDISQAFTLSRDGLWINVELTGGSSGTTPQSVLINTSSGAIVAASQVNGELADPGTSAVSMQTAADGGGRRAAMSTNSPNLLGRTDCATQNDLWGDAACASDIVIADLATGTVGVLPNQALGCDCRNSLGATTPLQNFAGQYVDTATGSYSEAISDASLEDGGIGFDFQRTYNSLAATVGGPLGPGWSEPYAMSLAVSGSTVTLTTEGGAKAAFTQQSNGSYAAPPGVRANLTATGSGYTVTLPDGQVDTFDSSGKLTKEVDRNGRGLTFAYTGANLSQITDAGGRQVTLSYDATTGNISTLGLQDGNDIAYGYDSNGRLHTVTDPAGETTTYGYDSDGRLSSVTAPDGSTTATSYDSGTGRVSGQTLADGQKLTFAWDADRDVATVTDGDRTSADYYSGNVLIAHVNETGGTTSYTYDDHLDETSVTDADGNTTAMTYDTQGNMLSRTTTGSRDVTESWTYDGDRNVTSHTDGRGNTTSYGYDSNGRLTSVTDPLGNATSLAYTTTGQIHSITDGEGKTTTYGYDAAGNLTSQTDPLGDETTYSYDAAGRVLTMTDPRGNVSSADPAKYTTTYAYDAAGRLRSTTDPLGNTTTNGYDAGGHLVKTTDGEGNSQSYAYNASGQLTSRTDAAGHTTTYAYDSHGLLASVTDALGDTTTYTYDAAGRIATMTAPDGNAAGAKAADYTTSYSYDQNGNLIKTVDPTGAETDTTYDEQNRPIRVSDPLGNVTATAYDASCNTSSVTDAMGSVTKNTYNKANELTATTDPLGNTTSYTYDKDGRQLTKSTPSGATTSTAYDAAGRVTATTDPRGNAPGADAAKYTTTYTHDPAGNLLTSTDPLGNTTSHTYDGAGNTATTTDPDGHKTTYTYDKDNRQTTVTDPLGNTTTTRYDAVGNTSATIDPLGDTITYAYDAANHKTGETSARGNKDGADAKAYTTTYGYDASGNQTTVTDPLGNTTTTAYDADGHATTVTDPLGHATTTAYDADGNITSVTDPTGAVTKSSYDKDNRLTASTDPLGNKTTYTYDLAGHQLSKTTPGGDKTTSTYDSDGRITATTDPRGNTDGADTKAYTTSYSYDLAGNQTSATDPLGHTLITVFDADNRQTKATDQLGRSTAYAYDGEGHLTTVTDQTGAATAYTYDAAGNLVTRTDANNHTTTYGYDAAAQLTSITTPAGATTTYGYDPNGNRTTTTDARNITTTATFDARNLVTALNYNDTTSHVAYGYDADGHQTSITDGTGTRTLAYDSAGHLTGVTMPGDGNGAFAYAYDAAGHITSRTYPDGEKASYTYNADGLENTQTEDGATLSYGYDPAGNLTTSTLPAANGYTDTRTYDADNRLATITTAKGSSTLASWTVKRDAAGEPIQLDTARNGTAQDTQTFAYDDAGRLTSWCTDTAGTTDCPTGSSVVTYGYDKVGNRTSMDKDGTTTAYNYNDTDELTKATTGTDSTTYSYDADGNLTGDSTSGTSVTYDANNRPISATADGKKYTFTNDDQGNRVTTAADGSTVRTDTWDTNDALPQLATSTDGSGKLIADNYTNPLGLPQAEHTGSGTDYDHLDWNGSVADVTDASGTSLVHYAYDPFGTQTATPVDGETAPADTYGYAGQLNDSTLTGKMDLRARTYDPSTGRFTSTDPITLRVTDPYVSAYVYGDDAPTYESDPSGASEAPGRGWWLGGSTYQHNFALEMAYEQEVARYGANNVYADIPVGRVFTGGRTLTVPTYWNGEAEPDLIAFGVQTPRGIGYAIWDVKPASAYGRSIKNSVDKLAGYIAGFSKMTGYPTVSGDPIVPEARIYPKDPTGAEGVMVIFNGAEWDHFDIPAPVPNGRYPKSDISSLGDTRGLIFYALDKLQGDKARSRVGAVLAEFHAKGAELGIPVAVCRPTAIPTFAHNPLQAVGVRGSADLSGLERQVASTYQGVSLAAPEYPEGSISSPSLSSGQSLGFGGLGGGVGTLLETLFGGGQDVADGAGITANVLQDAFALVA